MIRQSILLIYMAILTGVVYSMDASILDTIDDATHKQVTLDIIGMEY